MVFSHDRLATINVPNVSHFLFIKFGVSFHVTINLPKIINILVDLASNGSTLNSTASDTQKDNKMANMLLENMESLLNTVFSLLKMISC